ncbi:DUF2019 domain-containing protein [Lentzea flava]|uniref:DUF2019 domain-containing protein n=1 Tax=Lentzea flava TaxID=103732 RepID=A0ABQ2U9K2_9PSEU|nr:DUF2019 domain-containing protein [Lentzea flava]MCP2196958.1 protein of unknown function (DUF2019) [Lentzea flava]GGU14262.1 hypothetical protein GCM10010178_02070 [Lentzea flava]
MTDRRANDVERLAAEYLQNTLEWDEASDNARKANVFFDRIHALYKQLRETEAGRAAIASLMNHPQRAVQLTAAGHSLAWCEAEAVAVLEEIEKDPGLLAISAKYTLKAHREGTLEFDW